MFPLLQSAFEEPEGSPRLADEPLVVHRRSTETKNNALVVFVHGLGGNRYGAKSTWGNFPRFIFEDFPSFDVGLYEFRTLLRRLRFWQSISLGQEAEVFGGILREATNYTTILLVGHSMGGLLCMEAIRYFLKSNQGEELRRITAVFLMATPQAGSQRVPRLLARFSKDFRALEPHGDFVKEIQSAFTNYVVVDENAPTARKFKIPVFAVLGSNDNWVDGLSAGLGIPDSQKKSVRGSHTEIVKPPTKEHDAYLFFRGCVERRLNDPSLRPLGPTAKGSAQVLWQPYNHVDRAVADLESLDAATRKAAVHILGASTEAAARAALVKALDHSLPDVSVEAAFELARLEDVRAIPVLVQTLRNVQGSTQDHAERELARFGNRSSPALVKALRDPLLRAPAVDLLGQIRSVDAVPELLKALDDNKDDRIREAVASALGHIGNSRAIPRLLAILRNNNQAGPELRIAAAKALGRIRELDHESVKGLMEVLSDEAGDSPLYHLQNLPEASRPRKRPYYSVRAEVANTLGEICSSEAVEGLIAVLRQHHVPDYVLAVPGHRSAREDTRFSSNS